MSYHKQRVLVDVDGVICDFHNGYLALVKKVTGRDFVKNDITEWDIEKALGLTAEETRATHALMFQPGFVRGLSALPGAYEGITYLKSIFEDLVFVTAAHRYHPTWANERWEWLNERWPGCRIISTHEKECVAGDVLIDDKIKNLEKWSAAWSEGVPYLFDGPYNQGAQNLNRIFDLKEVRNPWR